MAAIKKKPLTQVADELDRIANDLDSTQRALVKEGMRSAPHPPTVEAIECLDYAARLINMLSKVEPAFIRFLEAQGFQRRGDDAAKTKATADGV